MILPPPRSPLFPYTTLFRSLECWADSALSEYDVSAKWDTVGGLQPESDRKSTRLNSSHVKNSYAAACRKVNIFRRADLGHADHNGDKQFHSASDGREHSCADRHTSAEKHESKFQWRLYLQYRAKYGRTDGGGCGAGFASRTGGDVPNGQLWRYHGESLLD